MKKIILVFTLFIFTSISLSAQTDTYKATLNKMLKIAGTEETFKGAIGQMLGMFKQQKNNVPDSVWKEIESEFAKVSLADLVDLLTPVYQKHLTEADLKKLIEFYQTPVGKKYAEKTPVIMQESMQAGQQWGMQIGQKLEEKLKAKGY